MRYESVPHFVRYDNIDSIDSIDSIDNIDSIDSIDLPGNNMFDDDDDVIYQTRGRVFHQVIQTPRSVLKTEAVGRVF